MPAAVAAAAFVDSAGNMEPAVRRRANWWRLVTVSSMEGPMDERRMWRMCVLE